MLRNILIPIVLSLVILHHTRAEEKPFVTKWRASKFKEERELILPVKGENYKLNEDIVRRSTLEHPYRKKLNGRYYYRTFEARLGPQGVESVSLGRFKEESDYYLEDIAQFGAVQWTSMHRAFAHCGALTGNFSDTPDLSRVTDISEMFLGCYSLTADLSKWEVGTVTNMNSTFRMCTKFTSDLADWNVSKVTDMAGMFQNCPSFNADLSQWKVNQVSRMDSMFLGCSAFNTDLSAWKVDKVTNMAYMFANCPKFDSDLSQWNVSKVTDMAGMFQDCPRFNADISGWEVSQVKDMTGMFTGATLFNQDLGRWNLKNCKALSLANSGMSVENYSKCLIGWAGQDENNIPKNFQLDATGLYFNEDARTARTKLIQEFGWTIKGDIVEGGEFYPLSIGGIELTSDNVTTLSETLTQKGLLKRGKIAFDAKQKILTLDSVQLETVILSQASKLQIHIVGKCSVKQICTENTNVISNSIVLQGAALTDSLQTQGILCNKLSIRSCSLDLVLPEKNPLEPLYWLVNNANVHIKRKGKILENSLLGLHHCAISYPLEAYLGNSVDDTREEGILFQLRRVYVKDALTELRISVTGDIPEDALYIAEKKVSKDNLFKFALLDEITLGEEGYIFYDASNKTLRMKNVTIEARDKVAIKNLAIDGLCIEVEGDNSIKTNDWGIECKGNTTICGTGKLSIHSKEKDAIALFYTTLTIKDAQVQLSGIYGIKGHKENLAGKNTVLLNNASVSMQGYKAALAGVNVFTLSKESHIIAPIGAHFEAEKATVMDICDLQEVQELRIAPLPLPSTVLYICPPTYTLFAYASHYEPTLFANVSWIAKSSADWLRCSPASGDGETKLRIEVEPNSATDERRATITFTPVGDTVFSYTLSITQKKNIYYPGEWLDQSKLFLRVGDTHTLVVEKQLESDQVVYWSSDDPRIASVENGNVTAHAEGETTIWARIDDQVVKCIVIVRGKGSAAHEVENFPSLTVSPNPFTDALRLDHHEPLTIAYQLLNPQGVVLRTGTLSCGETRIETENLPAGLYLLRLTSVDGAVRTLQVVKE